MIIFSGLKEFKLNFHNFLTFELIESFELFSILVTSCAQIAHYFKNIFNGANKLNMYFQK